jgi:putative NADPH-quinone reductase
MRVFIVHAHPEPASFNGAMMRNAVGGAAILKGWVDRVFALGRAYGGGTEFRVLSASP